MSDEADFLKLIQRVRDGDQTAAAELLAKYEPAIRRAVNMQLRESRLRRHLDSMDICQSVLGNFFVRVALGQFDLKTPQELLGLLTTMARNKLATHARRANVARRVEYGSGAPAESELLDEAATPSKLVSARDLLETVRQRFSPDECYLAEPRAQGRPWQELADERGASIDALRKQLTRALDRVASNLSLDRTTII